MRKILTRLALAFSVFSLSACGGGGSSSSGAGGSITLSGVVEDGPIAGARVTLVDAAGTVLQRCGTGGAARCETVSAGSGAFSLQLPLATDLADLELVSVGGTDRDTGVEFGQIRLRAPLALFSGREGEIVLSPLTSLVAGRAAASRLPVAAAESDVLQWLGLRPELSLSLRPSAEPTALRQALLLTTIALELAKDGETDPLTAIGREFDPRFPLFAAGATDSTFLAALGLDAAASQRIGEMAADLAATPGNAAAVFRRTLLRQGLAAICQRLLGEQSGFDPADATLRANLDLLTEEILAAAGNTRIPLGSGVTPQRIARYVFFTYGLLSLEQFTVDAVSFLAALHHPETGRALRDDPQIAELASLKTVYSAAVPLLDDELPGDDNSRRLEYFYNSDLSPFYFAEKVNEEILDDAFSDAVMLKIADSKAQAGLLAEAEAIVATQIYQTAVRGDGYYRLADALIDFGRLPEAVTALHQANAYFRQIVEAKGFANIKTADVQRLQHVGSAFRRAGNLAASRAVFDYLAGMAPYLTTTGLYGSVVIGTRDVAKDYIADGEIATAVPLVEFMHEFARGTPANVSGGIASSFQAKVFYLVETARLYDELGRADKVSEIYREIEALRKNDGLRNTTADVTWVYMDDCIELLYRSGLQAEAYALADDPKMPAADLLTAMKKVATFEAERNGLPAALAIIEVRMPQPTDRIEALTYFANNKSREYVALALINRKMLDTARQALDRAVVKMALLAPATDADRYQQLIQRGYVKIADLYALTGARQEANNLLYEAELSLAALAGVTYRIDGYIDIAKGYFSLGDSARTEALLEQARGELATALAAVAAPANAAERSKLYQDFALVYERLIAACLDTELRAPALLLVDAYVAVVRQIFDPQALYADQDKIAGTEVDKLVKAAGYRRLAGNTAGVADLLAEAEAVTGRIAVAATRNGKIIDIVAAHAAAGRLDAALALARAFAGVDRYRALQSVAMTFAARDDFPQTAAAGIDTDFDGRPDFFHPLVADDEIAASGLVLDDDCDGDGIRDLFDRRPLVYDERRS